MSAYWKVALGFIGSIAFTRKLITENPGGTNVLIVDDHFSCPQPFRLPTLKFLCKEYVLSIYFNYIKVILKSFTKTYKNSISSKERASSGQVSKGHPTIGKY